MKIDFADAGPTGEYALVLPLREGSASLASLGAVQNGGWALDRQRFEGDASSVAEQFVDDGGPSGGCWSSASARMARPRRLRKSWVALGGAPAHVRRDEGRDRPGRSKFRCRWRGPDRRFAAALRSWRHDRYRTKLKDKQKPTLDEVVIVGGRKGAAKRYEQRWAPVYEGVSLDS